MKENRFFLFPKSRKGQVLFILGLFLFAYFIVKNEKKGIDLVEDPRDAKAIIKLNNHLAKYDTELCMLYEEITKMEALTRRIAEVKYPMPELNKSNKDDYSEIASDNLKKVNSLLDKLREEEKAKIKIKYNIEDSIFTEASIYGLSYCN